eukprot:GFKZ01001406.1.p1 GENE.GFKZ01001406.1~~GFKZ01001406.1.p1  ORF type:complete len:339 (+),score=46.59 GFKZ01001406.1:165-1181(+)
MANPPFKQAVHSANHRAFHTARVAFLSPYTIFRQLAPPSPTPKSNPTPPTCTLAPRIDRRTCLIALLSTLTLPSLSPKPTHAAQASTTNATDAAVEQFREVTGLQDLAFEFTNQHKYPQAEYIWTKLISLNDRNAAAYSNRGNCRTSQGKFELALADFDRAIQLAPDEPDPLLGKGVALEGVNQFREALDCYQRANQRSVTKYGGQDPVALNNMGNAHAALGEWEDAVDSFKSATQLDGRFVFALANEALALYQLRRDEEALRKMRFLVRKYPSFGDMHAAIAMAAWEQGESAQAENEWYKAVEQDSRYEDTAWVRDVRRWPPRLIGALESFRTLSKK